MRINKFIIIILINMLNFAWAAQVGDQPSTPQEFIARYEKASPYEILQVNPQSTTDEINSEFRKISLKWHPDRWPNQREDATEAFKIVGAARDKLIALKEHEPKYTQETKPAHEAPKTYDSKIIQLDANTPLDINEKMSDSHKTYFEAFDEQKAHNLPLILSKLNFIDSSIIFDTLTASKILNYLNLMPLKNLRLDNKIITSITYYYIYPNNAIESKHILYPASGNTYEFIQNRNKILSNLSSTQISDIITDLFQKISPQNQDEKIVLLMQLLLDNNKINFNDKISIFKFLASRQDLDVQFPGNPSALGLVEYLIKEIINLYDQLTNENEKNEFINLLKNLINKFSRILELYGINSIVDSLLASTIPKKDLILFIFDFAIKGKSLNNDRRDVIYKILNMINKSPIDVQEKNDLSNLLLDELKKLPRNSILFYANSIFDSEYRKYSYNLLYKLYHFISVQPNLPIPQKIETIKNTAEILKNVGQYNQSLGLYLQLLNNPELTNKLNENQKIDVYFSIGIIYYSDKSNPENIAKAVKQFEFISNYPTPSGRSGSRYIKEIKSEANFELGKIYFNGSDQIPRNLDLSKKYFSDALSYQGEYTKRIKPEIQNYMNQIKTQSKKHKLTEEEGPASKKPKQSHDPDNTDSDSEMPNE